MTQERDHVSDRRVHAAFCNTVAALQGIAYTLTELLDHLQPRFTTSAWVCDAGETKLRNYFHPALSHFQFRIFCKLRLPKAWIDYRVSNMCLRNIKSGDIVYMWPPYSSELSLQAKKLGAIVVAERTNCMGETCRAVLQRAYSALGCQIPPEWFTPAWIAEEKKQMSLCDYVTAPNDFVVQSLIDARIEPDRILKTSYGWSPQRLASALGVVRAERSPVFAFVGLGIVRKGLDLLLKIWDVAGVKGTLIIVGKIDEDVRARCGRELAREDVKELGFVIDIATVYAQADVFLFPSHEEGGPMVVYEACASGLAAIVSPMGAGRIVRDGIEGYVIDPFDKDAWVDAIRMLARDVGLRRRFGDAAAARAQEFTWARVGKHLGEQFLRITGG
jgi:glycosyltransferase involved in cell wall biosynthesis